MLEKFKEIGFKPVGSWKVTPNGLTFDIEKEYESKKEVVYAFISDEIVHYVGKTDTTLKNRMTSYKNGKEGNKSGSTNKEIYNKIFEKIQKGCEVKIYVLFDIEINHMGYKVSISSGIEPSLISALDPKLCWNSRYSNSSIRKISNKSIDNNSTRIKPINSSEPLKYPVHAQCALRMEYFLKGLISFSKSYSDYLPKNSNVNVQIEIADSKNTFTGKFTRSSDKTIINGHDDLKDWYNKNFKQNDIIDIEILREDHFRLSKHN